MNKHHRLLCWSPESVCAEAARRWVEGKDANLLSLVQFLLRDLDQDVVPVATGLHCIKP